MVIYRLNNTINIEYLFHRIEIFHVMDKIKLLRLKNSHLSGYGAGGVGRRKL